MCPRSGTIERQREYKIDSIDGGRGGCGGGYVAQLRDFGSFVKQRDSAGDDRGADRNVDVGALPLLFFVVLFDYLPSLLYVSSSSKERDEALRVRDLYRTHLSLPNRKKERKKKNPGLSYLFFFLLLLLRLLRL